MENKHEFRLEYLLEARKNQQYHSDMISELEISEVMSDSQTQDMITPSQLALDETSEIIEDESFTGFAKKDDSCILQEPPVVILEKTQS